MTYSTRSAVAHHVPSHTLETIANYLKHGWAPGGFVESMLAMDMERVLATADVVNRERIWHIGHYIMNYLPEDAWGNYDVIRDWIKDVDERRSKWNTWNSLITEPEADQDLDF